MGSASMLLGDTIIYYINTNDIPGELSRVEKYFTRLLRSLVNYFSTLIEKFRISARP